MGKFRDFNNIPSWTQTLGSLHEAKATLRAVCDRDHPSTKADLNRMLAAKGPLYCLWNRTFPCLRPGCTGRVFFSAHFGGASGWPTNMKNARPHEVEEINAIWRASSEWAYADPMCNRYGYKHPYERMVDEFSIIRPLRWAAGQQSNFREGDVSISDIAPIIRIGPDAAELSATRWAWKGAHGKPVFNFRSDGRDFSNSDRVLIPAACFYEFTGAKSPKTRWTFTLAGSDLLMIAGIVKEGSFSMLTTEPGPDMAPFHDRQVVVLPDSKAWLAWGDSARLPGPLPEGTLAVVQA